MQFEQLYKLSRRPKLYELGNSIMWTDPYISKQLLECHLNPNNDMASRSNDKINLVIDWIEQHTNKEKMDILDLGCGPGLYAEKFASHGHKVSGVDFSSNSIAYAKKATLLNKTNISYYCKNYLDIDFKEAFDLVILIYLDFCVLNVHERKVVIENVYRSLRDGGVFIFDVVNSNNIEDKVLKQSWDISKKGFWSDKPYIVMNNGYNYKDDKVLLNQHIVITEDEAVKTYHFWSIYYDYEDIVPSLKDSRYKSIESYNNVLPKTDAWTGDNISFYIARK